MQPGYLGYFPAPVFVGEHFLGAVAGKVDLPYLAPWINQANSFITDAYGVIIQAQDKRLEMRALPGAWVQQLSPKERLSRYRSEVVAEISIHPWTDPPNPALNQLNGSHSHFFFSLPAIFPVKTWR